MDFVVPYDQLGISPPGPWTNASPAAGTKGSIVNALAFPPIQNEILNVQDEAGLTRDSTNSAQLLQAIRSGKLTFFADTGAGDALAVTPRTSFASLAAGVELAILKGPAGNATTTPKLSVGGSTLPLVKADGTALAPGDLPANVVFTVRSDGTSFRVTGLVPSQVLAIVLANITAAQIFKITQQAPPGSGLAGTLARYDFMPTGPASSVLTTTFVAPADGTVQASSIFISTPQNGGANAVEIDVNGTSVAQNADSVAGLIINVAAATVSKGDTVTVTGTVSFSQAAIYNTTQRFTYSFIPS